MASCGLGDDVVDQTIVGIALPVDFLADEGELFGCHVAGRAIVIEHHIAPDLSSTFVVPRDEARAYQYWCPSRCGVH